MILLPNDGSMQNNSTAAIFVLTNPGQLQVYDGALLSVLKPEEGKPPVHPEKFPVVVPTIDPCLTVTKLCLLPKEKSFKALPERVLAKRTGVTHTLSAGSKWPLTGGVPSELSSESYEVEKIYVVGYQDGSVRMWDATYSVLLYMFALEGKVTDIELDGETASVSALDFCSINLTLAVGNACGLEAVCCYLKQRDLNIRGHPLRFYNEKSHATASKSGRSLKKNRKRDRERENIDPNHSPELQSLHKRLNQEANGDEKSLQIKRKRDEMEELNERKRYNLMDAKAVPLVGTKRKFATLNMAAATDRLLWKTVFIRNLSVKIKVKWLLKEFAKFGEVESVKMGPEPVVDSEISQKGAINQGKVNDSLKRMNAYIVFKDEQSVHSALSHNMAEISGDSRNMDQGASGGLEADSGCSASEGRCFLLSNLACWKGAQLWVPTQRPSTQF